MNRMLGVSMNMLALYTVFFIVINVVTSVPTCPPHPAPVPSADSPAPASIPGDESPEICLGSVDSPIPANLPSAGPPETDLRTPGVFDVTEYGAIPDGKTDSTEAFLATWDAACGHAGNSIFYVPNGTYYVHPVSFAGPCYSNMSPVVKIEGTLMAPTSLSAFPNSKWIEFKDLSGIVLTGRIGVAELDAQGGVEAWKQVSCREADKCKYLITSLKFTNVSYGTITNISLSNGKGFHVGFYGSNSINAQNIQITAPGDSPNTDGIHISHSTNINITSSTIGVGDDCVSIGPGSINISISNVNCGPGHGISVGSLGKYPNEEDVVGIHVQNSTIEGTQNGIRVKTWPGSPASNAHNMTFEDIVMINVSNPIIVDQEYCPSHSCNLSKPSLVKLSSIYVKNISGTYNTNYAVNLLCSSSVPCENIQLIDINLLNTIPADSPEEGRLNVKGVVNGLKVLSSSF